MSAGRKRRPLGTVTRCAPHNPGWCGERPPPLSSQKEKVQAELQSFLHGFNNFNVETPCGWFLEQVLRFSVTNGHQFVAFPSQLVEGDGFWVLRFFLSVVFFCTATHILSLYPGMPPRVFLDFVKQFLLREP